MAIPVEIIDEQAPMVQSVYRHWDNFMRRNVRFNRADSVIHSMDHTERVLLHALILGHEIFGDNQKALTVLAQAAVFHDTRRKDDGIDNGHGRRGARYYDDFCKMNRGIRYFDVVPLLIHYHNQDDLEGRKAVVEHYTNDENETHEDFTLAETLELLNILKDADALDRPRLGEGWFDPRFLRTEAAKERVQFGRDLVEATRKAAVAG